MLSSLSRVGLLRTGFQLGLFEALREPQSGERLADRLGLAPELVDAWLRAAHSHGLLSRSRGRGGEYRLGGLARWLLEAPESESLLAWLDLAVESYGPSLERLPALMQGAELPEFGSVPEMERAVAGARLFEQRALEALTRIPGARAARRLLEPSEWIAIQNQKYDGPGHPRRFRQQREHEAQERQREHRSAPGGSV